MRYDTILGYVKAAIELFQLRNLPPPFLLDNKGSIAACILANIKDEENIAVQRAHLSVEMYAEILKRSKESNLLSMEQCIADFAILGRYLGPRLTEYAQKSYQRAEIHKFPSGKEVVKAICSEDIIFTNEHGRVVKPDNLLNIHLPTKIKVKFKVQKNRRNGEEKEVLSDANNEEMCPVKAAYRIVLRAALLKQPLDQPVGVYQHKNSTRRYLVGSDISKFLRKIAKKAHPDMTEPEIKRFSAHSFRVTAAVLLHEQGHDGDFIKIQLRWLSDSYRVYLRSTKTILQRHTKALGESAALSIDLANLPKNPSYSVEQIDPNDMGEYHEW